MLGFIGLALLAGLASASVAVVNMRGWYTSLSPPPFAPPNPPPASAWGILAVIYLLMAVSAWRVWRRINAATTLRSAMNAWGWQLALGAAWPALFFGFHAELAASIVAATLVPCVAATTWRFARLDARAGILLVPYLVWAGFASYLSAGFWRLSH